MPTNKYFIRDVSDNDALPLEYKLQNRNPFRQVDVSDFVNNTSFFRIYGPEESCLKEKLFDVFHGKVRMLDENVADH